MPCSCVCDTLQTSKDASNIFSVVEKLLPFVKTCRRPITHLSLLAGAVPWLHGEMPEMYEAKYLEFQQFKNIQILLPALPSFILGTRLRLPETTDP